WEAVGGKVQPALGVRIPNSPGALYNLDQTDRHYEPLALAYNDPDAVLDAIIKELGVKIEYGSDATCKYIGAADKIRMPHKCLFELGPAGISGYFDAKAHELMHASER